MVPQIGLPGPEQLSCRVSGSPTIVGSACRKGNQVTKRRTRGCQFWTAEAGPIPDKGRTPLGVLGPCPCTRGLTHPAGSKRQQTSHDMPEEVRPRQALPQALRPQLQQRLALGQAMPALAIVRRQHQLGGLKALVGGPSRPQSMKPTTCQPPSDPVGATPTKISSVLTTSVVERPTVITQNQAPLIFWVC